MTDKTLGQIAFDTFCGKQIPVGSGFNYSLWDEVAGAVEKEVKARLDKRPILERILSGEPFTGREFKEEALNLQNQGFSFEIQDYSGNWLREESFCFDSLNHKVLYRLSKTQKTQPACIPLPVYVPWDHGDMMRIRRKAFRHKSWTNGDFCYITGFTAGKYLLLGNNIQAPTFQDLLDNWKCSDDLINWSLCGKLTTESKKND